MLVLCKKSTCVNAYVCVRACANSDSDAYLNVYSSEIHMHMTSDRRPWITDLGPRTADIGPLFQSFSFNFSVSHPFSFSAFQPLSLSVCRSLSFSVSQYSRVPPQDGLMDILIRLRLLLMTTGKVRLNHTALNPLQRCLGRGSQYRLDTIIGKRLLKTIGYQV